MERSQHGTGLNHKTLIYERESYIIRGGCFEVYKQFRNLHKEKVYGRALAIYLRKNGLVVEQEKQIPLYFGSEKVGIYIPDIVVNDKIFLELKCSPFSLKKTRHSFGITSRLPVYVLAF